MIYACLLGIPMVLLLMHTLTVLLQPSVGGQQVQGGQRHRAAPLRGGRVAPGADVEGPAGA